MCRWKLFLTVGVNFSVIFLIALCHLSSLSSLCLSVCPSVVLLYRSIFLSIYLHIFPTYLFSYLFSYHSVFILECLSMHPFIYITICRSLSVLVCLSMHISMSHYQTNDTVHLQFKLCRLFCQAAYITVHVVSNPPPLSLFPSSRRAAGRTKRCPVCPSSRRGRISISSWACRPTPAKTTSRRPTGGWR